MTDPTDTEASLQRILDRSRARIANAPPGSLPFCTLTYAQSLDGSISNIGREPLLLSGGVSMIMTHGLRAAHDAILVGVGTVIADNPSLTCRLCEGEDPLPVVLDSLLRTPLESKLVRQAKAKHDAAGGKGTYLVIITTTQGEQSPSFPGLSSSPGVMVDVVPQRGASLDERGAARDAPSRGITPHCALARLLAGPGCRSVMVEGGASIISSFIECGAVDDVVVTIAPVYVGGVRPVRRLVSAPHGDGPSLDFPRLAEAGSALLGDDTVVFGRMRRALEAPKSRL